MFLMEAPPKSSFLQELREKHIARAYVAACISAGLTLVFGLLALTGTYAAPGFDAWILLDAAILGGLAFGVARRSRVCAVVLVAYGILNTVHAALAGQSFPILGFIFIYFYIRGAIALFSRSSSPPPDAVED